MTDEVETAAGRAAGWYVGRLRGAGAGANLADAERFTPELARQLLGATSDEAMADSWRNHAARFGPLDEVIFASVSELEAEARITAKDKRWKFTLAVEAGAPHRIERVNFERIHDFVLEVREARPDDALTLADIERRCPIVHDGAIWFERGERWFDFSRLMEDCTAGLASVDGAPAAVTRARHTVRIGGALKTILTVSHLRVLPEHQRKGLWGAVNGVLEKYWPTVDGSSAYIAVGNAGMQHGFRHNPDKWPIEVKWARLDTAALAGPPAGRGATRAEAGAIAGQLNAFHEGEEMFVPYSDETLAARMERAPDLYGWENLKLADGAVVGVWPAGAALRTVTERDDVQSVSQPGVVLDYAFAPGAEGAFEALVRAWCAWLAERGMDRLSIFTSPASPGAELITSLASEVLAFNMWTPGIPAPADAAERGLYVDPVYF
jgi:hypothetical protein